MTAANSARGISLAFLATAALVGLACADEMEAPVDVQISLLYKVLTFDRNLAEHAPGDSLVIAILFQDGYRASVVAREQAQEIAQGLGDAKISGLPVRWIALELDRTASLETALTARGVDVIYLAPLRGAELDVITAAAREASITTFTGVPRYVDRGIALGVGLAGGRPRVLVNLGASRAEGADLDSNLLRVAQVLDR